MARAQECPRLTIEDAIRTAISQNPALTAVRRGAAAARADIGTVRADLFPQVDVQAQYTHESAPASIQIPGSPVPVTFGTSDSTVTSITARQYIYTGGRVQALVSQSEALYDVAVANLGSAEAETALGVRLAFYNVLLSQAEVAAQEQNLAAAQSQLRDAQARFEAGVAAQFDVLRAQTQVSQAEQALITARNNVETAFVALNRAMGVPQTRRWTIVDPGLAPLPAEPLPSLVTAARSGRGEVLAARAQVAAQEAGINIARAQGLPTLSIAAAYNIVSTQNPFQNSGWTISATATLNLFNGGRTRSGVSAAEARTEQARANLEDVTQGVEQDLRQTYLNLTTTRSTIDTAETTLRQAAEAYDVATVRYQAGVGTATELADALAQLVQARANLNQAHYNYNIAWARLQRALGRTACPV
jgi:TolC family type I secretion outer membrane protein